MTRLLFAFVFALIVRSAHAQQVVQTSPRVVTIVPLRIATVTTGGTAVQALNAGDRVSGGLLVNPKGATIDLCINEDGGTASGTTTAGSLICIQPGTSYNVTASPLAVSVITSDSAHPFGGKGYQ